MKFQDKLSKLRKEKNLSQEALAEKLGMSRQAISKWESGSSYPDMPTIIKVTKVLDCNLEDLIDDDTLGIKKDNNKNYFKNIGSDILGLITKTYNMFWSMKFIGKIKCILEIMLIILMCYFISYIFGMFLKDTIFNIFNFLPTDIYRYVFNIFKMLYSLLMFIISFVITLHLFKIRYLDYYITIEDNNVKDKIIEKDVVNKNVNNNHEKIIIRDPKHTPNAFTMLLFKFIRGLIKIFIIFILLFLIIGFIFLVFLDTVSLLWMKYGIIFLGLFILFVGLILNAYVFIELMYRFIFNMKYYFKRSFILFIISLFVIGIGSGIFFIEFSKFDIHNDVKYDSDKTIKLNMNNDIIFDDLDYYNKHNKVIIDNNIKDIEIEIEYNNSIEPYINNIDNYYYVDYKTNDYNVIKYILNDIKNKKINLKNFYDYNIKNIKISKTNYDKIISNNIEEE